MRHYFRFMELEPVLELEEDSVGDESPSSSMGSPSLSPPPDVWAQLAQGSREQHDSAAYNMLLQDHLDLQRAFRLLEVQYRNCEHRASRAINESYAQIQGLKDSLKAVLLSQETDKVAAVRDELHRGKEREARLNEDLYDLREQNELLEFRILELEECNEHTSLRSVELATRDVASGTDDADFTSRPSATFHVELERAMVRRPTASVSPVPALSASPARSERQSAGKHLLLLDLPAGVDLLDLPASADQDLLDLPAGDDQVLLDLPNGVDLLDLPASADQDLLDLPNGADLLDLPASVDQVVLELPAGADQVVLDLPAITDMILDQELLEPRASADQADRVTAQRDGLWMTAPSPSSPSSPSSSGVGYIGADAISCTLCRRSPRRRSLPVGRDGDGPRGVATLRKSKSDGDVGSRALDRLDGIQRTPPPPPTTATPRQGVRATLDAIHALLKETRVEVECTNSELREEVVTLEGALVRLARRDADADADADAGAPLQDFYRRHRCSLSPAKECHCCSQDLRPALDEVICKMQHLALLVDAADAADAATPDTIDTTELTSRETERRRPAESAQPPAASGKPTEAAAIRKELRVWNFMPDTAGEDDTMQEESIIRAESDKVVANIESMKNEMDILEKTSILRHASEMINNLKESSIGRPKTGGSSIYMERPTVDENFDSCKPVLRRWREHLNVRESRAKSWAGATEFPNAFQPTAAV